MNKIYLVLFFVLLSVSICTEEEGDKVCGFDQIEYENAEAAHAAGTEVMHCGPCGQCSNFNDVGLYWKTKDDLTKETRKCAFLSFISSDWARDCLKKKVPFTDDCMDCWIDNIECDVKHCSLICLWSWLIGEPYVDDDGKLNSCLQCDEDKCGPAFKKCAGANRRRSCIKSDIMRDDKLICKVCDPLPEKN